MKLTTLILLAAILQVSATTYAQKVTLKQNNVTLKQLFKVIRQQTGYDVLYRTNEVNDAKTINANFDKAPLSEVLDKSLDGEPLQYTIEEQTVVIKPKDPSLLDNLKDQIKTVLAIPVTISGRVTDSLGTPLIGATVAIKATGKATNTDDNGGFTISAQTGDLITISYVGYQSTLIVVKQNTPYLNIILKTSSNKLKEVVVSNGYQNIPQERATGSFVQVDSALFNNTVSPDIISRLQGNVPGLLFNNNTNTDKSSLYNSGGYDINIQGHTTIFSNDQPLLVVDGFPYDGDYSDINPNDVESVTVLKDAAAASIWGARSGNGVIVITTKKGKLNQKLKVEINSNVTIGDKPNLFYDSQNWLNSNDFINAEEKLFNTGYYSSIFSDLYPQAVTPVVQLLEDEQNGTISAADANTQINALRNVDSRDQIEKYFYQKSVDQQYSVNLSGGTEKATYYFSAGYDNDLANLVGNKNDRLTLNSQNTFRPIKNLEVTIGLNHIESNATNNSTLGNFSNTTYPYMQVASANGTPLPISKYYNSNYLNGLVAQDGLLNWQYYPLNEQNYADNTSQELDTRINTSIGYTFLKDFRAKVSYQYEKSTTTAKDYYSLDTYYARNLINEFTDPGGSVVNPVSNTGGILNQQFNDFTSQNLRTELDFNHDWSSKHRLSAIAGAELNNAVTTGYASGTYGYNDNTITSSAVDYYNYYPTLFGSYSQIPSYDGFSKTTTRYIDYFANASYTYLDRYTISASARIDKSNLFGVSTNQKSNPLYSTGFLWDMTKEDFYHLDWLSTAKLRVTFGYTGNLNNTATAVTTFAQAGGVSPYTHQPFATITSPGNPDLRWERDQDLNFGFDFGLKNQIVTGSIDYFLKKGLNLFGESPIAPSFGLNGQFFGNTANTKGNGFDLVINTKNISLKDFKWTSNFVLSHVVDIVTRYDVTSPPSAYIGNLYPQILNSAEFSPLTGKSMFEIYSYKYGGLTATGDPQGYLNGKLSTDYTDILANTTLQNMVESGNSRPTTYGSFRNTFTYGRLSLSLNMIYKLDYYFRKNYAPTDYIIGTAIFMGSGNIPSDQYATSTSSLTANRAYFYSVSTATIDNGNNVRLQDARLNYDLKDILTTGSFLKGLQVYGYINNIGILWRANKDHLDPDVYPGSLPTPRTYSLGVSTNF